MADTKHHHHEKALSGVKASRARLMNEAESWKKEVTQGTFRTKKSNRLYRTAGVYWLLTEEEPFSSATTLRLVDLECLPRDITMGPLNTR